MTSLILVSLPVAAMLCFVLITARKAYKYHRFPIHSRLELYPIPREGNNRAEWGGSYFEEAQWWKKPRALDNSNELKAILAEMLLIHRLFKNKRSLWWASYSFHLGIYALFAWTILLLLVLIWPVTVLAVLSNLAQIVGFVLALIGTFALLIRRIFDSQMRHCTTPVEYFNLSLILFVLVTGTVTWFIAATPFTLSVSAAAEFARLSFSGEALASPLVAVHLIALSAMLLYIPASKMSHYVGKFFAFHKVLWDNDPNQPGSPLSERIAKQSEAVCGVCWLAPHINPGIDSDTKPDTDSEIKPGIGLDASSGAGSGAKDNPAPDKAAEQ